MRSVFQILFVSFFLYSCGNNNPISDKVINKAMDELKFIVSNGHRWEKVHAAEFLLELGYDENIYEIFSSELQKNGHKPQYRIGIWRVLYRSAKADETQKWSDSIYNIFIDTSAPDRIHAAETLAKLKIAKQDRDSSVIESILALDVSPLWFYTHWWIIPQLENGSEKLKKFLFDIVQSDQYDAHIRSMASYVIREDKSISLNEEEWQTLRNIVITESGGSELQALLAVAAFSKAPDNIPTDQLMDVKEILSDCKDLNAYQYCLAYAEKGVSSDVDKLTVLLDNEDADIRNAAAYAILRINQRSNQMSK